MASLNECRVLHGVLQCYAWGKMGMDSKACELYAHNHPDFTPDSSTPYAEMWLGTHPSGPSTLESGETLEDFLKSHPEVFGEAAVRKFGKKLPFLMKILSVRKALSIQAHPDKELAVYLHSRKPEIYKDDNHKPEMLLALSDFKAMCCFRPKEQLLETIRDVPEIRPLLPEQAALAFSEEDEDLYRQGLKHAFSQLITAPKELVTQQIINLKERLEARGDERNSVEEVVYELVNDYPNDAGVFCPYLLNIVDLRKGEAIFIPANEPHSYLSGDGVECMATSDNVVRAGLTNKLVDKETLLDMLTYISREPNEIKIYCARESEFSVVFPPPVEDFAVAVVEVPPKAVEFNLPRRQSASILLVVEGDAKGNDSLSLMKGGAFFLPADFTMKVSQYEESPRLLMFQAFVNV